MSPVDNGDSNTSPFEDTVSLLQGFSVADNPLINLSAEYLALLATLSQQKKHPHLPDLYQYLFKGIRELHNQGLRSDYPPRVMEKTCYVLCAAFDEEIMNSQYGQEACWENQTLVAGLFKQRNAGEFFFTLLERALQNSSRMVDFLELQYLLLRMGFKGKYINGDEHLLSGLTSHLYDTISKHRQEAISTFLPSPESPWQPLTQSSPLRWVPAILMLLCVSAILAHLWIRFANDDADDTLSLLLTDSAFTLSDIDLMRFDESVSLKWQSVL